MRRLFALLAFMIIALASYAQDSSEYLTFKGVPIKGSMAEFCQKLKATGLTYLGGKSNSALFEGDFTGRHATIGVAATDDGGSIYAVVVFFDSCGEWNSLVSTYDYMKNLYTRKYGEPSVLKEYNPARIDSNVSLMAEVTNGTVVWASLWEVAGGEIELSIESASEYYEGMIMICYRDAQNEEAKMQDDLDEI